MFNKLTAKGIVVSFVYSIVMSAGIMIGMYLAIIQTIWQEKG